MSFGAGGYVAPNNTNLLADSVEQILLGNYTDKVTLPGTAGQIVLGLLGLDLPLDIRDLSADIINWEWSLGHFAQSVLDGLSVLPVIGMVKYTDEIGTVAKNAGRAADAADDIVEGAGNIIKFGSDTKSAAKLSNQMTLRGWTESTVIDTVSSPYTTRVSTNMATGNAATVFYNQSGGYVIIDDVTKAVVQVSDNINPTSWIPDVNIINPYRP